MDVITSRCWDQIYAILAKAADDTLPYNPLLLK